MNEPMRYDFDKPVDRRGSGAIKFDALQERYGSDDLLPLWVADMDFETPPFVVEALRRRLDHPVFGYTAVPAEYRPAIVDWQRERHGWEIRPEWLTYIPGIVKGIGMAIHVFTRPGDRIVVQPPIYHPFHLVPQANGREVVWNPLRETDDGYEVDFAQLEPLLRDERCRLLLLSNPHNPAGIVWDEATLRRLAELCAAHGVVVVSDEIHADMALFGNRHRPFASVCEAAARNSITFAAPSKTFNIAGIVSSYAVVPDDDLRRRFFGWLEASEFDSPALFAPIATVAAYRQGESWRRQMVRYIEENVLFVERFCREQLPAIRPLRPQASFLVWLDCRALKLPHERLVSLFVDDARLALNDGEMFGPGGEGFMRLNVGTRRAVLEEALGRLKEAIHHLK